MTLRWADLTPKFYRGYIGGIQSTSNWVYRIDRRDDSWYAMYWTYKWEPLNTFDSLEEAKKFVELFELTGART